MSGDTGASLRKARMILKNARQEVEGEVPSLGNRQAAEKVWLAVTTAADAMVGATKDAGQVVKAFKRAYGTRGDNLARSVQAALHIGCFYSDSPVCVGRFVDSYAREVGDLLSETIRDSKIRARIAKTG